jgi:hypothetical protein
VNRGSTAAGRRAYGKALVWGRRDQGLTFLGAETRIKALSGEHPQNSAVELPKTYPDAVRRCLNLCTPATPSPSRSRTVVSGSGAACTIINDGCLVELISARSRANDPV